METLSFHNTILVIRTFWPISTVLAFCLDCFFASGVGGVAGLRAGIITPSLGSDTERAEIERGHERRRFVFRFWVASSSSLVR